jgi:subtilase family serine protease
VGASKSFTFTGLSAGSAGSKTFRAFVDSQCGTAESNERNNQRIKAYTVSTVPTGASLSVSPQSPSVVGTAVTATATGQPVATYE